MPNCSNCGNEIDTIAKFCANCGTKILGESDNVDNVSTLLAENTLRNEKLESKKDVVYPPINFIEEYGEKIIEKLKNHYELIFLSIFLIVVFGFLISPQYFNDTQTTASSSNILTQNT